jgi:hypothetical protein
VHAVRVGLNSHKRTVHNTRLPTHDVNGLSALDTSPIEYSRRRDYRPWLRNGVLILTALFAFSWIVHRARVQSITLDEANTFRYWVAPDVPSYWQPHSNNHVLNSMLMRLFVSQFGLSHLTLRAPALLGAIVYIFAAYAFCNLLRRYVVLPWAVFVCFVYNPLSWIIWWLPEGIVWRLAFCAWLFICLLERSSAWPSQPSGKSSIMLGRSRSA